jgi:hypothetical protein
MIKVLFAPCWGQSSAEILNELRHQSPGGEGRWGSIIGTDNVNEANFLVVQDNCESELWNRFHPKQRLYFSREALDSVSIQQYSGCIKFSYWDGSGWLWTKWRYGKGSNGGLDMSYDELIAESPVEKTKSIACVLSNKVINEGHRLRIDFAKKIIDEESFSLDLFGGVSFKNKKFIDNNKRDSLDDYKYCLAFDNQDIIRDFFGTQFTDAVLRWTVPVYWGGADLNKYFPKGSYIQIDIRNPEEAIETIKTILADPDDYQTRLDALAEARKLILDKYNVWPTMLQVIRNQVRK